MLLKHYWCMVTKNYFQKSQPGLFWKEIFGTKLYRCSSVWGLPKDTVETWEISNAWRNHMIQPNRGLFSERARSEESLHELIEGFIGLCNNKYEQSPTQSAKELIHELFQSDKAKTLREEYPDKLDELMDVINQTGSSKMEDIAALTAVFWFCFSLRPTTKKAPSNPSGKKLSPPENKYDTIMAYLYVHADKYHFHPEDWWVVEVTKGRPERILAEFRSVPDAEKVFRYTPDGFENVPEQWQPLLELQRRNPDPFLKHYKERKEKVSYNSTIVGLMSCEFVTTAVPCVKCSGYSIDYLTHRTIEDTVKEICPELYDGEQFMDPQYSWLHTSLGVNVIVEVPGENVILLHVRGKTAEYGNSGKLYPSVVETVDLVKENRDFAIQGVDPITACVTRGLSEELGFPDPLRDPGASCIYDWNKIQHVSFARTRDFHQDNFFSIVRLHPDVTLQDVENMVSHAREHQREIHEIRAIPSDPQSVVTFMLQNKSNMIFQTRYALWLYACNALRCQHQQEEADSDKMPL